jgi:hypothetical protein
MAIESDFMSRLEVPPEYVTVIVGVVVTVAPSAGAMPIVQEDCSAMADVVELPPFDSTSGAALALTAFAGT